MLGFRSAESSKESVLRRETKTKEANQIVELRLGSKKKPNQSGPAMMYIASLTLGISGCEPGIETTNLGL